MLLSVYSFIHCFDRFRCFETLKKLEMDIHPNSGTLEVGQVLEITMTLSGYKFGHFTLPISCHFQGTDPLSLKLKGSVIAPKLEFDIDRLDFGSVSYGFENRQIVSLHNDSDIPVKFKAYIPLDELKREFQIKRFQEDDAQNEEHKAQNTNPENNKFSEFGPKGSTLQVDTRNIGAFNGQCFRGCIYPQSSIALHISFKSVTVQKYKEYQVTVDIDNVGTQYLALPIMANCIVPEIEIEEKEIDLQQCFLNYEYSGTVTLRNDNELPVTYQFIPQNDKTKTSGIITFDSPMAILKAKEKKVLEYHFYAGKLGECELSSYISVIGSTSPPKQIKFHFVGTGPKLKLSLRSDDLYQRTCSPRTSGDTQNVAEDAMESAEEENLSEINFGNIVALKQHEKVLLIENICPIEASIHAEIYKTNSSYSIQIEDAVIKPNAVLAVTVSAYLNDTIKVTDDLMITVSEGDDIVVSLLSKGIGTTLVPNIDMKSIDFENQFTNNKCSRSFRIENRGRRYVMYSCFE